MKGLNALVEAVRVGESTSLSCKEVRFAGSRIRSPSRNELADDFAAFANTRGGIIVFGVHDETRAILGIPIERLDLVVDLVRELSLDLIDPPLLNIILQRLHMPSELGELLPVVKVRVPRSPFVHRSPGGYMERKGESTRHMATNQLANLIWRRSQMSSECYDSSIVPEATLDDLVPSLWNRFRTTHFDEKRDGFLVKLGMASQDENGVTKPTIAGILMASENPCRWFPNAFIQAVAYRGNSIRPSRWQNYQLDAKDLVGPLEKQIIDACRFVFKNMQMAAYEGGRHLGRRDLPQFDMVAVFEALVNAVAHRDYSVHGSKIRLRLFSDRLEISTPGDLVNSMKIESLRYLQAARNSFLCSLLTKCKIPDNEWLTVERKHFMEKRGEGVTIILDESERLSGRAPEFRLIDNRELKLTIFAAGD